MSLSVQKVFLILSTCSFAIGCPSAEVTKMSATEELPVRVVAPHLPNAIRVHDRVISGGQPDGEAAFEELQSLGIKTLISVDGAKPDVALAAKYGMHYVHMPHGYNGISDERAAELAKAVRDFEGPIYIHCHHGKHRSPAAAAVACVTNGMLEKSAAPKILQLAGTSQNYLGLHQSAANARRIDDSLLDAIKGDFPEIAELPPFAEAMVELEHTFDHLKSLAAAKWELSDWKTLEDHPDLDPAHEALLLSEYFTEMLRLESVAKEPAEFRNMLEQSKGDSQMLETLLRARRTNASVRESDMDEPFKRLSANCAACHKQYRDVPLSR